jgi:dynamin 1-like protein
VVPLKLGYIGVVCRS